MNLPPASNRCTLVATLILAAGFFVQAHAAGSGILRGSVLDPQGRAVAGAHITVRNADFNTARTLDSNGSGESAAPLRAAGSYTVTVEAAGFEPKKLTKINVNVGSAVRLTIRLQLATTTEEVTVRGRAATVEGNTVAPEVNRQEVEA